MRDYGSSRSRPVWEGAFPGADSTNPIQRILLSRFPYVIVFLEVGDTIRVIAIMHSRQKPGDWLRRLTP